MALICKNCGGKLSFDSASRTIVCEFCGAAQPLTGTMEDGSACIYKEDELSKSELRTYQKALSMMRSASSENAFRIAAQVFREIPDTLNADLLANECMENAELLKSERLYRAALSEMQSEDPEKIGRAIEEFRALGEYRDSPVKMQECIPLQNAARQKYQEKLRQAEEERALEEKEKQKSEAKRKVRGKLIALWAVLLAALLLIGYFSLYSSRNLKITLSPRQDDFITETYNGYLFHYDVRIENRGLLDVSAVECTVTFEKDGEIIMDTAANFYAISSPAVRAKKSSRFTWELTVYSYDTALTIYETDFDDLQVRIEITGITYANGKRKTY